MLHRLLFQFPGVGSHYSGMGSAFYERYKTVRDLFTEASDILHLDMRALCFLPEKRAELNRLEHAQAALLCVSVGLYRVLREETGLEQGCYLGYSLGEYPALCCAGALEFCDALRLVWGRGTIVTEVAAAIDGSMAWVVNLAAERVAEICESLREEDQPIFVSAYDSPEKTSISGTRTAIRRAGEQVVAAGGIPIPINMSGPFHSPLMQPAAEQFRQLLAAHTYRQPAFPVISNVTARPYASADDIPAALAQQLISPIRWRESLAYALGEGVTESVEIGPKNVLSYVLEKNTDRVTPYVLDTLAALEKFKDAVVLERPDYLRLLSRCLTIIVGTKNTNSDPQVYEERVVGAFRAIQSLHAKIQAGELTPDEQVYRTATDLLAGALRAKCRPEAEIASKIKSLRTRRSL